jgi:hypothetical protein
MRKCNTNSGASSPASKPAAPKCRRARPMTPDRPDSELLVATGEPRPIVPGDVLATGPLHKRVPLSIWPKVSVQRPHTDTWHVPNKELGELEDWTRTVAVPHLVTGSSDADPLPPPTGHHKLGTRTSCKRYPMLAPCRPSHVRSNASRRPRLVRRSSRHSHSILQSPDPARLEAWVNDLSDDAVLARKERLGWAAKDCDYVAVRALTSEC